MNKISKKFLNKKIEESTISAFTFWGMYQPKLPKTLRILENKNK